ncbi:molybdopterin molybdenumtransferase MoeA [candidate division KSB3 bacterium]|uniref:Molybdopterin molybdenumtransferase n=1 Tax=candidate division KSB3 bacterium TaxID=2044937 RepID=A0A2G6E2N4_9BACT|nr:MAG: molybdopterin molybdenumtransferase MoeA [candidate division KSB3 bacterium]PIE29262.1 MAG: molybdopterin molybdenumtransferase MoeA [candidate division KSB3 bacterium]
MLNVKSVEDVFRILTQEFSEYSLETETVPLLEAAGRVLAREIVAEEHIPAFDRSTVDGYAVISRDTSAACEANPAQLLKGPPVEMGSRPAMNLTPGMACYIPTGGQLPPGADGVVMVEQSDDYGDEYIYLRAAAAPGAHIIFAGDDMKKGELLFRCGKQIRPADLGVLAALGVDRVPVKRTLKAGIVVTGDEIVPIDQLPTGSQVRDINSYVLYGLLKAYHVEAVMYGIIGDSCEAIETIARKALKENDLLLISGGSSAGEKDETAKVIDRLGKPGVLVHGIAVKPGKPTIIGRCGAKAVLGLPGHPASALTIATIFVTALLEAMMGRERTRNLRLRARIRENYPSNSGREEYVPAALCRDKHEVWADVLPGTSGQIGFMSRADGYIHIRREQEGLMQGDCAEVLLAPGAGYDV